MALSSASELQAAARLRVLKLVVVWWTLKPKP